jgi:hypothetical protein
MNIFKEGPGDVFNNVAYTQQDAAPPKQDAAPPKQDAAPPIPQVPNR